MMTNRSYAWRIFLQVCLFALVLAGVSWAQTYQEAPQLAERVAAGDLPPVEERLPASPMEVPVLESIGTYGGDLDVALVGGGGLSHLFRYHSYEPLVRWTPDWEGVIPNVASSWEVNDEATAFTFGLREGMKWSDGEPFTADDIMFWYEDVLMNNELTPSVPTWLTSGDEPVVVTKVDDYTVTFTFAAPQGLFLPNLGVGRQRPDAALPEALSDAVSRRLQPRQPRATRSASGRGGLGEFVSAERRHRRPGHFFQD